MAGRRSQEQEKAQEPELDPTVEAGTGTSEAEVSEQEQAQLEERAEEANQSPSEAHEAKQDAVADQNEAAGYDRDADPVSLSESGNRDAPVTTSEFTEGDKELELTVDEVIVLKTLPQAELSEDARGVTRIVTPDLNQSGWSPAPLEPDPVQVAELERRQALLAARDEARLAEVNGASS